MQLTALPVEGYTIDIAVLRGKGSGLVVHSSGVHGVEGYAGSAIQVAALRRFATSPPSPTVVIIHAVNPWGMAHFRRWNENNVDLNRNALWPEEWADVLARDPNIAGYESFDPVFNPRSCPGMFEVKVVFWLRLLWYVLIYGFVSMKRSIVTGTYTRPTGVFFGGQELQRSHVLLRDFLQEHFSHVPGSEVSWLDVHTGLGKPGVDVLLGAFDAARKAELEKFFPGVSAQDLRGGGPVAAGYDLSRGVAKHFYARLFPNPDRVFCVTQEFGTCSGVMVARALILENAGYHHDFAHHDYWRTYTRDAFYVRTEKWKQDVLRRGLTVVDQLLQRNAALAAEGRA